MSVEDAIAVVEQWLIQGRLSQIQEIVFRQSWEGQTYMEIARHSGYDLSYVKDVGAELWQQLSQNFGEKVTKHNFQGVLKRAMRKSAEGRGQKGREEEDAETRRHGDAENPQSTILNLQSSIPTPHQDWGEAIDVSTFYGRTDELTKLKHWIVHDRCQLITLLGMGGIGKTALSVKLAKEIVGNREWGIGNRESAQQILSSTPYSLLPTPFTHVIWRSLRDAPPIHDLLTTLIAFLSHQQETTLPESVGGKLSQFIEYLRQSRCLIVLDNFDAVLQEGQRSGFYRKDYEDYGELLRQVGEIAHQSCVVLTSREKPYEVAALSGEKLPVRALAMAGLDTASGQDLLALKGLAGSVEESGRLIDYYRGNPLALKISATSIQDLFAGDIARFLEQETFAFNGIRNLLKQQCDRLSPLETQIMDWLAINREPVTPTDLQADLMPEVPRAKLIESLESLRWRSLIESSAIGFTQQPVIMEYITDCLIEKIVEEIVTDSPSLFLSHALIKAQAKDYIRESQIRIILQPIITHLLTELGSPKQLEHKLEQLLNLLRKRFLNVSRYGAGNLLNLLCQLDSSLSAYDFSKLPIHQAYLQDATLNNVNFTQAHFANCTFTATFGSITCIAFSPDNQRLATSDTNGGIQIWNAIDGQQLLACSGHDGWVWSVTFSPDQSKFASSGQDHTVRLWDANTGHCIHILQGHTSIVMGVAYSPNADLLASCSVDQTIRLWDLNTGTCQQTLQGHHACVWSVAFHPHKRQLASAGEDNLIRLWDLDTGTCLATLEGHQHWVKAIAFSPDGQTLASGSFDQTVRLWNMQTGTCLHTLQGHGEIVTSVSFSPDEQTLASGSHDQTVRLWSVQTGECLRVLQKHRNRVWSVAFDSTGTCLASGGDDHAARLWDVRTGQNTKTLQGHSNSIYAIAWNPDRRLLASGHEDQTIKLWHFDPTTKNQVSAHHTTERSHNQPFRVLHGHTYGVFGVAFSPDGNRLASASLDRTIKLWNPHTGQCLDTLYGHSSWVWAVAFNPQGDRLASASYDQTIKLWNVHTRECLHTFRGQSGSVLAIAFSPDGQTLLSGSYNHTVKLWQVSTGKCLKTLHRHTGRVWRVAFSPDGQQFATGGDDQTIQLWNASTGEWLQSFTGHTSHVLSLLFSADGQTLVSSSADSTIKVWDVHTGNCLKTLQGHHSWVWSLLLDPDHSVLLSSSQDETIRHWNIDTGECLQTLHTPRPYEGMNITGATGLTDAQRETLQILGALND